MIPLIAVAHGSRDPRSAATITSLVGVVRAMRPGLDARVSFMDLSAPRLGDVLTGLRGPVVVVPLLLGRAYHAKVDVPALVHEACQRNPRLSVSVTDVLGPSPRLESAALRRLTAAGAAFGDPSLGVILAGAGSSDARANARVAAIAQRWAVQSGWAGAIEAFAASATPDVPTAAAALRARGASRIAVASWFLAPGLLPDRVYDAALKMDPDAVIADPLGADPDVAELILHRYDEALQGTTLEQTG
ncbi:sirohydrochlorin chelatase [Kibdelosporangium persicum]|uniref:Sirohydrochlorin ferrochelatase n=1 Tax=Kibdelosporangium persicum TaxID=2698649 RepID=A0ABX2F7I2_9PSEU|nr:sirohydrochlorin chelatase [Kibdelosporangium persicum]NRN66778.1 Sirohydrochlorin ferrochelatase [Kibdelosporangium persicum]